MAKQPAAPAFTLQPLTAPKPTWWQTHRHQVLSVTALIGGFVLGQHSTNAPATPAADNPPAHTAPANTTATTTP
ncbi:hypothetical protein [Streptomyces colonosanans]|uniref:Uncharacterized protein n=1 Tax=Streptomyces colonosanans TaxID=1428652 RepID=A0A1S2PNV9_9ACTN|nr:hypothetical protein [Streptomyces colonosanans]OIJ95413.1 hypothetical protein BIV24_09020 [Streptomyces colonosanans]